MRKITSLFLLIVTAISVSAQITYPVIYSDNFETTNGFPLNFNVLGQQAWITLDATKNPNPYTSACWKDVYSSNTTTANKTYSTQIFAENRTGGTGSQCLKFNMTGLAFGSYATPFTVRLRGNNGYISFNTAGGEGLTKYEFTFWARVDGSDKAVILNTQNPNTYLTITTSWQQFTLTRYTTGTSASALSIDFFPLSDNSDYSVYIDDVTVKQRLIPYTSAASSVTSTGFTANWASIAGATSYNVTVEKSDGGTPAVWTAISGSPFSATTNSMVLSGLDANAGYRYTVTATDGTLTTFASNTTSITTSPTTGLENFSIQSVYTENGKIFFESAVQQPVTLYNAAGQKISTMSAKAGLNSIAVTQTGLYIVKTSMDVKKVIVK